MELQHFSHTHPLIFKEGWSHESNDHKPNCSACGMLLRGPSFGCVGCGFYLHKKCADAPVEMDHPFHPNHSFALLQKQPYKAGDCSCGFCGQKYEHFVYHCSCKVDLHIECALFTYNIAKNGTGEFQHILRVSFKTGNQHDEEVKKIKCLACWLSVFDSEFFLPDSGCCIHVRCVDLLSDINHPLHPQHPLIPQFTTGDLFCKICQNTQWRGFVHCCPICDFVLHTDCATMPTKVSLFFHRKHPLILKLNHDSLTCQVCDQEIKKECVYCCSICKFAIHIECASSPPIIEHEKHPHPFQLLKRRPSYICDACGTPGNHVSYTCHECSIMVHRKCILLPPAINFHRHHHPIFHNYFLENDELEMLECGICRELVGTEYGSYFCSKCNYIVHDNCALVSGFYSEVDPTKVTNEAINMASYLRVTDTCIYHFSHPHNLEFHKDMKDDKQCNGCLLFICGAYYYCSQCDFFLHESCAELPRWKHMWFHHHQNLLKLSWDGIFKCSTCEDETSGFAYGCNVCKESFCLRCALVSDIPSCEGHEHPLPYYLNSKVLCNACGGSTKHPYRCKRCNFNLHGKCLRLPLKVQHKSDMHLLRLTYSDKNNYSESHYCDICEGKRNSNHWFYYCAICDNSVHVECAIGRYSFIKLGSIYTKRDHSHPLTFVQRAGYYPECRKCDKPCHDLALECKKIACDYIVHWECVKPSSSTESVHIYSDSIKEVIKLPHYELIPMEVSRNV